MESESKPGSGRPIAVVVIDDEALVRTGFTHILNSAEDIEVVGSTDGVSAAEMISGLHPDVVLLDIRMPGRNGLEVLSEITGSPGAPVVAMLTTFDTDEHIADALQAGASGFLVKDTDPAQFPNLIRTLYGGGVVLSPGVSSTVVAGYLGRGDGGAIRAIRMLTNREREVLLLLAAGDTNSEIASKLFFSVGTVKSHVSSILAKLGVKSRIEAALVADRAGLLR